MTDISLLPLYLGDPVGISAYADRQTDSANTFLLRLGDAVANLTPPAITPEFPTGGSAPALNVPALPTFSSAVWTSPAIPTAFTGSLAVDDLMPAPFDESAPILAFGTAPAVFSEAAPAAPAVNLAFADPTLTVALPAPPNLLAISLDRFDGLNMPTFSETAPALTLVAPSIREYTPGALYTSALLGSLQTALQDRIDNGGTGLTSDVENALWDRSREREARSYRDAVAQLDQMEALGFAFPPGIYLDARLKIITEMDYANRGHTREVMIKAAELEQANVTHALSTATQVESMLVSYSNSVEQRLFDATKYATEAGIALYNAGVQAFVALVDVYKTKVQIYEAQVRAETARVDAYRAQVEAERAKAETNTALVQQYKAQADVALANIEIYKAQIAAIQTKAEIEKIKVQIFGEQIQAYSAKVNAYTAGVEGYRASLEAEKTKVQVYQSQVEAFSALVGAAAKQADVRIAEFRGLIDAKTLELDGYKATISGETARVNAIVSGNATLTDIYKAQVSGVSGFNEVLTKQWQAVLDQNQKTAEIAVTAAKANAELYVTTRSLAVDAAKVGAQVSAQLGAAALNAINWSTHLNNSNNYSKSEGSEFRSSIGTEIATHYNYNYSQ